METFLSQQGEGFYAGQAAYFIRLGGCDVGCHWCDTIDSWSIKAHPFLKIEDLVQGVEIEKGGIVVVTGGEPTLHNLAELAHLLTSSGFRSHIETAGSHELTGDWDWICLSPKKPAPPKPAVFSLAHELKVVIHNQDDFRWAEENAARVTSTCQLYLQPEWSKEQEMKNRIEAYIEQHPEWKLSVQTHKHLGIR